MCENLHDFRILSLNLQIQTRKYHKLKRMKHNYLFAMAALLLSGAALLPLTSNGQIEYVDLGLPSGTLWANMNVGATQESDSGFYYQWGDTVTRKADFSWKNYKWCNGTQQHMTKYCTDSTYGDVDNKLVLDLLDDAGALAANVGSPTKAEFDELLDKKLCKWTLDTVNDRKGARVTGPNGNSIFLPAYGFRTGTRVSSNNLAGCYATNTLKDAPARYNYNSYVVRFGVSRTGVSIDSRDHNGSGYVPRNYGYNIRPVKRSQPAGTTFTVGDYKYVILDDSLRTVSLTPANDTLVDVVIPETVKFDDFTYTITETTERAFNNMKTMKSVDVPRTLVKFGKQSFNGCSNLKKTTIHDVNAWMRIDFSGSSLSNPTYQSKNLYLNDSVLETAIITDTISQVNPLCFYYCQTLKKVVLPPTVKKIGKWGFYRSGVEEVSLPEALTTSEDYAFQYSGLKTLSMPANYTVMKNGTFAHCKSLQKVKIADNMITLPMNTFQGCNALTEVEFNKRLKTIKKGAFVATALKDVVFPDSLEKIENQSFVDPIYLETITFGEKVNFIGYMSFYVNASTIQQFNWKTPMKAVLCKAVVPPTIEFTTNKEGQSYAEVWNEEVYTKATLYVPASSIEAYKNAPEWKRFVNVKDINEYNGVEGIDGDAEVVYVKWFTMDGVQVSNPAPNNLYVKVTGYSNGQRQVSKVLYR